MTSPAVRRGIDRLRSAALATGEMKNPVTVDVSEDNSAALVSIPLIGDGTDSVSEHALATLRKQVIPATIGSVGGVKVAVTGTTAGSKDFNDLMKARAPIAGVVASAALVMVGVFSIFATLSQIEMKQLGVGLAAAILIDATLVRAVLLPATMKLLGD